MMENDEVYSNDQLSFLDGNGAQSRSNMTRGDIKKILISSRNFLDGTNNNGNTDAFIKLIVLVLLALGGGSLYFLLKKPSKKKKKKKKKKRKK